MPNTTTPISRSDVLTRAEALLDALGTAWLGESLRARGWTVGLDARPRVRLGRCTFRVGRRLVRRIDVSARHAAGGWTAEVEDTIRHEIAHALDFETRGRSGHDDVWRRWAERCGAVPRACAEGLRPADAAAPFEGRCDGCGHAHPFYRRPVRAYRCPACRAHPLRVVVAATGEAAEARPAFVGTCPACGASQGFARRPRRTYACVPCCTRHAGGRFDRRFALAVTEAR